ncbi:MAG: hypothetical protein VYD19_02745 [Myxococcota bacterium]|nr:hypothetical protein [Myxococcota bacterium]
MSELERSRGGHPAFDQSLDQLKETLARPRARAEAERGARRLGSLMARTLQAALLIERAPTAIAEAFCAARLAEGVGQVYGDLPDGIDCDAILARLSPAH